MTLKRKPNKSEFEHDEKKKKVAINDSDDEEDMYEELDMNQELAMKKGCLIKPVSDKVKLFDDIKRIGNSNYEIMDFCLTPNGLFILTGDIEGTISKYDIVTGSLLKRVLGDKTKKIKMVHNNKITCIGCNDDYVASGDNGNKLSVRLMSDLSIFRNYTCHLSPITAIVFRINSNCMFSSDEDGRLFSWELPLNNFTEDLGGKASNIICMDTNRDNNLISCSRVPQLQMTLWKLDKKSSVELTVPKSFEIFKFISCSMINEQFFLAGTDTNQILMWDSKTKKSPIVVVSNAHSLPENKDLKIVRQPVMVTVVESLKETNVFASGSNMSEVKLWSIVISAGDDADKYSIEMLAILPGVVGCVNQIRFLPGRKSLAVGVAKYSRYNKTKKRCNSCRTGVYIYKIFE